MIKPTYGNVLQLIYKTIVICYYEITKYNKIFSAIYTKNKNENSEVFYANR